jgi:hypothetical protein
MQKHDDFMLVRFLHSDGWITYRILNADGTEPEGSVPEHLASDARMKIISFIGDPQYNLSPLTTLTTAQTNLIRLQGFDPFLFESILVFLETANPTAVTMFAQLLAGQETPRPASSLTDIEFTSAYKGLTLALPLVVELFSETGRAVIIQRALGGTLLRDAQKSIGDMGHPHFRAVLLATWIMQQVRFSGERLIIDYSQNVEDIAYIEAHLDEVKGIRGQLGDRNTIDRNIIAGLLAVTAPSISDGWL